MRARSRSFRFGFGLWAAIAGGATGAASESTDAHNGLQAARRDYEALKAANARTPEQKAAPNAELPVLDAAPPSARELLPTRSRKASDRSASDGRREKSSNWLLEAMRDENETNTTAAQKLEKALDPDRTLKEDVEKGDLVETALALEKQENASRKADEDRRQRLDRQRDIGGVNPLNDFMASWMSSGDFELLGRTAGGAGEKAAGIDTITTPSRGTLSFVTTGNASLMTSPVNESGSSTSTSSWVVDRPNPYLENLPGMAFAPVENANNGPVFAPLPMELSAPAIPTSKTAETAPTPAPPTPPSERFRVQDDSRYFKQLKRF